MAVHKRDLFKRNQLKKTNLKECLTGYTNLFRHILESYDVNESDCAVSCRIFLDKLLRLIQNFSSAIFFPFNAITMKLVVTK